MSATKVVAVFGSSITQMDSDGWSSAERLGAELASAGLAVVTGGYGGTMEAVSRGAAEKGGRVIGVTAPSLFPDRSGANEYVGELIEAEDLLDRIGTMIQIADGVIVMPGSIGTAAELLIVWNHNFLARRNGDRPIPTVAVGDGWRALLAAMVEHIGAEPGDVHVVEHPDDALGWLVGIM